MAAPMIAFFLFMAVAFIAMVLVIKAARGSRFEKSDSSTYSPGAFDAGSSGYACFHHSPSHHHDGGAHHGGDFGGGHDAGGFDGGGGGGHH